MPQTILLVGTRKGLFVLEGDGDRRDWKVRGPYCEGWPVYHAVHDSDSGAIYAAAASEWHGAGVWRSEFSNTISVASPPKPDAAKR